MTLLYSLRLKRILVVDMMALAGLYTIRVIAGGAATGIPLSEWLLALSMFMFLSLAAVKRQSELMDLLKREGSRVPGRRYVVADLPMIRNFGTSAGYISVLVLALYINSPQVGVLYAHPLLLWAACPLLLYWISRMLMKAHRGEIHNDPIVFAFRDRASLCTGLAMAAVIGAAALPWP
jgi:4-hydroxybenzoate polyprenyltransferase